MKFLKRALAASVTFLALSASVRAADLIPFEPPPEPPIEIISYDWTGPYVGIQGGYGWAEVEETAGLDLFLERDSIDLSGVFLGAHAGYNFQRNNLVLGIEGDINKSWIDGDFIWGGDLPGSAEINWFGSLRTRLGYAADRTLFFGTAGVAAAELSMDLPAISFSESQDYMGWTAGLGIEHAFKENWLARAEYRYYDLGNATFFDNPLERDFELTMHTVSLGLTYRF